jgi:phosphomannomutase
MVKDKLVCPSDKIATVLRTLRREYAAYPMDLRDGVKVTLPEGWFLVRGSNTEPIVRVIAEAENEAEAQKISRRVRMQVQECL